MHSDNEINGKTILITGGTGSFGKQFTKSILNKYSPKKVIIFSRDEWKQWEMRQSDPIYQHENLVYFLGDVRDRDRLTRAFKGVDIVVHAAALKQVPAAEYNPTEFVKTNVHGAMNVIDAAIDCQVKKVVALSTDKAVNPVNLYGATKLCSDKLFVAGNTHAGTGGCPKFSVVRYGNVLGSRGSIIPLWRQMVREGASSLPITDFRMTRFWITLQQAVDFVLDCFSFMRGGEIIIPKIPSMKISDLAEAVAPGYPKHVCGIREGEKLHEMMINADDSRHSFEFPTHYVIAPEVFQLKGTESARAFAATGAKRLPEAFVYASNTNSDWLGAEALRELIPAEEASLATV